MLEEWLSAIGNLVYDMPELQTDRRIAIDLLSGFGTLVVEMNRGGFSGVSESRFLNGELGGAHSPYL